MTQTLMKQDHMCSEQVYQSILGTSDISCDQASVYRILNKFEQIGLVTKSEFHKDATRYSLKSSFGTKPVHQHHFKCIQCNTIESFSDCLVGRKEKQLKANGYSQLSHHLEITGLCPSCTNQNQE